MNALKRRRRLILGVVMAALLLAALRDLSRLGDALPWRAMVDFPDFYCAGWALDQGASPYTYEPLHRCEHHVNVGSAFRGQLFAHDPDLAVPAPLPPYDFLPFMALARLGPQDARSLHALAIVASVALCAATLAALGIPLELAVAALVLSAGYMELNTGQIVPFALLAVLLCGLALARRYDRLAGIFAVVASIEPIVGLPVAAAVLFFVPRARWPVVLTAGVFALLALSVAGERTALQYATGVVPAQAASELHFPFQYSATYALAHLGLAPRAAQFVGGFSYLILAAIGLLLAPRVAQAVHRRELLAFFPAFCCVIGGPYLHEEELCFALPALLVFAVHTRGAARTVFATALCALSIPWILVWGSKQLFLASLFVCALILVRLSVGLRIAFGILCVIAVAIYCFELHPPHLPVPAAAQHLYASDELVQDEWRAYAEQRSTRDVLWFAIKLPTWGALLAGLALATGYGLRELRSVSDERRA